MEIRNYILSVILSAIVSGVLVSLTKNKGAHSALIKLLAGIFITLTVISPLKKIQLSDIGTYFNELETVSDGSVTAGEQAYHDALRTSIIDRTETYILEKASSLDASLSVSVTVNNDDPPLPIAVEISGDVSPYAKAQLKNIISSDLGIPEDAQLWK